MSELNYNKTEWKAGKEGGTAWTPDRLNNIENGIEQATNAVNQLDSNVEQINSNLTPLKAGQFTGDVVAGVGTSNQINLMSLLGAAGRFSGFTTNNTTSQVFQTWGGHAFLVIAFCTGSTGHNGNSATIYLIRTNYSATEIKLNSITTDYYAATAKIDSNKYVTMTFNTSYMVGIIINLN